MQNSNITNFNAKTYVIVSGSMQPKLQIGDIVIVKNYQNYKVGDIVTYRENDNIVTHRIVHINKDKEQNDIYFTKGDNNNAEDNIMIQKNDIIGKVVKKIPKVGLISLFIEHNIKLIIIVILLIFTCNYLIKSLNKKSQKEKVSI